jgi:ubiquinone/menaquinone biosynthesis C-methylase UbiE
LSFSQKKVLDIGTGTSLLPFYLAQKKAQVTALDLKKPLENPYYHKYKTNPRFVTASVLDLPFKDNSFDLVMAVSTLEHLDADYQPDRPLSRQEFLSRTKKALKEMLRVCKKGGLIYITTDFYLPSQKTDLWPTVVPYKNIGGAYHSTDLKFFLDIFSSLKLKPFSTPDFDLTKLQNSSLYSNYRGRYFTTANFLYQKT